MHLPIRAGALSLAATIVLAAAACSSSDTPPSGAASTGTQTGSASGSNAATAGDPCALITAADVKTALKQTVSDTDRYESIKDDTGTTTRCALTTDGKPLSGSGFDMLSELASGFTGQPLTSQPAASVGVILLTRTAPYDASAGDVDKLPPGSKTIAGVGSFALVLGVPAGGPGGIGFAQANPTTVVVVYDLEDRVVPAADMETLLRAVVARV